MSADSSWLPNLVLNPGNWNEYRELIYSYFVQDFVESKPQFGDKKVGLKRHPIVHDKEATFWHFIQESEDSSRHSSEEERIPCYRRCERIRWPKPVMEQFIETIHENDRIVWWKTTRHTKRGKSTSYVLALRDFSYVVVVADRGDYVLPWTQYIVEYPRRRAKLQQEYEAYWNV